jgi:hypothetical protein
VIGVVVGVGYLVPLLGVGISELNTETFFVVVVTTTFVALPLLIGRFFRVAVCLDSSSVGSVGRIQFCIRHLMILTFIIACLLTIGRSVQPYFHHGGLFFQLLVFAVTFALVGIFPVWFILTTKQPVLYSIGLVAVGACAGHCVGRLFHDEADIWRTAAATEAMAVVVSLLVVRSCGYRLVR